jgi:tight adherence protein C
MTMLLAAIAASATAYTLIMPLFAAKACQAHEGGRQRTRADPAARARPLSKTEKVSLRQTPKQLVSRWWKTSTSTNGWRRKPRATS